MNHTSPYHTITYPTYTIKIYDWNWNDPYTFWTQSVDQSRFPFWLPWFLNEVNQWWLYTCVTIFWRLNRFLACETRILAVTPGTEYDVLVIDGTTDCSPSCRSATRVCVKGLGQNLQHPRVPTQNIPWNHEISSIDILSHRIMLLLYDVDISINNIDTNMSISI